MMESIDYVGKWTINFGKFKDRTFGEILETEEGRSYCHWLLRAGALRNDKVKSFLRQKLLISS